MLHSDETEEADFPGPSLDYCPVSIAARLVGNKWTFLIVRELLAGSIRFNDIHRGVPSISRTLLASRLRDMTRDGLVTRLDADSPNGVGYRLTPAAVALEPVIIALGNWAIDWRLPQTAIADMETVKEDPSAALWHMFRSIDLTALPEGGLSMEFRFPESEPSCGWMAFDSHNRGSVCLGPPQVPADLVVIANPGVLYQLAYGYVSCEHALSTGQISLEGDVALERRFQNFFSFSPFAERISERVRGYR
ncbi:winged helix-turn-helix transcriptional regulator [Microbacterium sp. LWO13-1.2]|uniref:winged helix-turn-helix transcriptional regulator n=1 Tax=Microbacterium sp. LWO13-1.2 TaxID=3135262 RepID=UPI00313A0108